jgi:predicted nucleotidyltransferase
LRGDTVLNPRLKRARCPPIIRFFGFRIRGLARHDSDIDVRIDSDPEATIGLFEFIEIRSQFSEALSRPVDLLTLRALSTYFHDEILRKAEPVHETCHFSVARRDNPK